MFTFEIFQSGLFRCQLASSIFNFQYRYFILFQAFFKLFHAYLFTFPIQAHKKAYFYPVLTYIGDIEIITRSWSARSRPRFKGQNSSKVRPFHNGQFVSGMARKQGQNFELIFIVLIIGLVMVVEVLLQPPQPYFGHFTALFSAWKQHGQRFDGRGRTDLYAGGLHLQ